MSTPLPEVLARRPEAPRRPSWRLATAVVLAVVALALALLWVDATPSSPAAAARPVGQAEAPRTPPASGPAARPAAQAAAASPGGGPAAAGIASLAAAPGGQDPLAAVPAGFPSVLGYTPVPLRMADGTVRPAKPTGACSAPGGDAPFGFEQVCKVHDYGYDLLRYAHATGERLPAEARRQVDAMFDHDLHARCRTRHGLARTGCDLLAEGFTAIVAVNSWRQHYGNPASESLPGWTIGLALPVLAAPFLPRLARRRGAGARGAGGRLRALVDATPAGRDRYVDFLRVVSIATVVLGHWTIAAVGRSAGGGLTAGNVLSTTPWLWLATWVLQVMPVFFFVGGFSNMVSWQALERRGGGYVEYLSGRMARLLRPVLVFVAVWLALPPVLGRLGLPGEQVELIGRVMGQPLWFLGVYLVVVALAPPMVRLHRRFRLWVPAALAAVAAAVDALRLAAGIQELGYLNLLVVWALVQQAGFFYADGTLTRLPRRALAGLGAAGLAGLVALTGTGLYPPSMVGLPGEESNMSPPTVCIVALTVWQVPLVMLARGRVSAWLARRGPWTAVIAVGSMAMTLYLWHLTAMVALYGLVLAVDGPLPAPGTGWWWATRPLWLALLAAVLVPMALVLSRFERAGPGPRAARPGTMPRAASPGRAAPPTASPGRASRPVPPAPPAVETPAGRLAAVLGAALATLGLLGFVASGFTPLLDPDGSPLLVLRVDPLANLAHLAVGAWLVAAARAGTTGRPRPWLLAAAGAALPLALPAADPLTIAVHTAVAALALAMAATRRAPATPDRASW
jgi:fucose 4-O-acetylase-like acetyltransferase